MITTGKTAISFVPTSPCNQKRALLKGTAPGLFGLYCDSFLKEIISHIITEKNIHRWLVTDLLQLVKTWHSNVVIVQHTEFTPAEVRDRVSSSSGGPDRQTDKER